MHMPKRWLQTGKIHKQNKPLYAHPETLVETEWVAEHLNDPSVCLIEVSVDTTAYDAGHIHNAVAWNWKRDTQQLVRRDIPDRAMLEELLARSGVSNDSTVVLY